VKKGNRFQPRPAKGDAPFFFSCAVAAFFGTVGSLRRVRFKRNGFTARENEEFQCFGSDDEPPFFMFLFVLVSCVCAALIVALPRLVSHEAFARGFFLSFSRPRFFDTGYGTTCAIVATPSAADGIAMRVQTTAAPVG